MILLIPAQLVSATDRADRSSKLSFNTRELTNSEFSELRNVRGSEGWLAFSMNPIQEKDLPIESAEAEVKTPAQRLRGVIFKLYKQEDSQLDFEIYYRSKLESIIEHFKKKLT